MSTTIEKYRTDGSVERTEVIHTEYVSLLDSSCSEEFIDALEQLREAVLQRRHGKFGPNRRADVLNAASRLIDIYETEFLT